MYVGGNELLTNATDLRGSEEIYVPMNHDS